MSFSVLEELESVNISLTGEEKLRLRGRIDQVDVCEEEDKGLREGYRLQIREPGISA